MDDADNHKKRGRPATGVRAMIGFRGGAEIAAALDAAAAADPATSSRSELIRRIVVEWLTGQGLLAQSGDAALREHEDHEIKVQARVDARRRNARVRRTT